MKRISTVLLAALAGMSASAATLTTCAMATNIANTVAQDIVTSTVTKAYVEDLGVIATNNPAFVSAVLAVPLVGADAGDLAEITEYGGYGTVGAALLALIAGLAALKRRMGEAETSLAGKADAADLRYALLSPTVRVVSSPWTFSGGVAGVTYSIYEDWTDESQGVMGYSLLADGVYATSWTGTDRETEIQFSYTPEGSDESVTVVATRTFTSAADLSDRAVNAVSVSSATTLTLPAAVAGYARDFLVRLEISGSTVPTITFAASGNESLTYETDGDEFPVPDEAGTWLYSFTETAAHTFAVSLKKLQSVSQTQGGS